jgi:transposase-like protein
MNLIELAKYLNDEELAEQYLRDKGILKTWTHCPHCNSDKLGKISRGRIKCYKCKKEWHKRKDSFLEGRHISSSKFIAFLKLFSMGYSMNHIHFELDIEFKTANDLCEKARYFIIEENGFRKFVSKKEFILIEVDQRISIMECTNNSKSLENASYGTIKITRTKNNDNQLTFNYEFVWTKKQHRRRITKIDRFLSFFNEKIFHYRGVSYEKFSHYFLESFIRFNNKDLDFYSSVCQSIHTDKIIRFLDHK